MAYNEHWSSVGLALRFTGSDGSTAITCDKGRGITLHGADVAIDTAWSDVAPSSGYYSAATYATEGSALEVAHHADYADWGTGAGTIAFTFRTPAELAGTTLPLFSLLSPSASDEQIEFILINGALSYVGGPWWDDNYYEGAELAPNTLYRVMLARNGSSTWKLMLNGVLVLTHVQSEPYAIGGGDYQAWMFGTPVYELEVLDHINSGATPFHLDEVFVVKGVALEFGAHTPQILFDEYAGGGGDPPEDVVGDMLGAIELSGELLAGQPYLAACLGALTFAGELTCNLPPFTNFAGDLHFGGVLTAEQPTFALMRGALPLAGLMAIGSGPTADMAGPVVLGGLLVAGRGAAGGGVGAIRLSGEAQVAHGGSGAVAGTLPLAGAMAATHRQAYTATCEGALVLSGLLRGDYLLYPPGEHHDAVSVQRRDQRVTIRG